MKLWVRLMMVLVIYTADPAVAVTDVVDPGPVTVTGG